MKIGDRVSFEVDGFPVHGEIVEVVASNQRPTYKGHYSFSETEFKDTPYSGLSFVVVAGNKMTWKSRARLTLIPSETEQLAQDMSNFVNCIGNDVNDVVKILAQEHRTLQQGITRFCVAWLVECANKYDQKDFDLRNEASAQLGKKFTEKTTVVDRALPFI
jgi:hypothetical protein